MKDPENRWLARSGVDQNSLGIRRALRIALVMLFQTLAVGWAQANPDVVESWNSQLLHQATRKAEEAETAVQFAEQFQARPAGDVLNPAEWPRAYAAVLARRAQALGLFPAGSVVSHLWAEREERAAAIPDPLWGRRRSFHLTQLVPLIRGILRQEGLPEQLLAVPLIESGFDPLAESPKGARGLWQLMPDTARRFGLNPDGPFDQRLDPVRSTVAAARYLKELHGRWGDWSLALAAYNAGPGKVQDALTRSGARTFRAPLMMRLLPEETRGYVPKVLAAAKRIDANSSAGGPQ
jgi:soluble lytic murein transglycosylase-like protein